MVTHSAVTPGRGLSHSTFFTFYATTRCAAKPLPSRQVTYFEMSKASVAVAAAAGTIQR